MSGSHVFPFDLFEISPRKTLDLIVRMSNQPGNPLNFNGHLKRLDKKGEMVK